MLRSNSVLARGTVHSCERHPEAGATDMALVRSGYDLAPDSQTRAGRGTAGTAGTGAARFSPICCLHIA